MSKYSPSTTRGLWGQQNPVGVDAEIAARLRDVLLVPHAWKCTRCGSTVVLADPLPHTCQLTVRPVSLDYGRCSL
jgi:hypothetical protein